VLTRTYETTALLQERDETQQTQHVEEYIALSLGVMIDEIRRFFDNNRQSHSFPACRGHAPDSKMKSLRNVANGPRWM
jgi:hypothetical protein